MANTDLSRFIPPNLRQPLSELGGIGYQLLDNLVGFDDEYDTTGELLARSLREDPVGTASSMATGVVDSVKGAYEDPMGTLSAMGDEFVTAYEMLSTPMDPGASREELGQRLEAASLLASVVPAAGAARGATRLGSRAAPDAPVPDTPVDLPPPPDRIDLLGLDDAPDPFANVQAPAVADDLARAADLGRLNELRFSEGLDFNDSEREEMFGLLRRQDTGEFDDLLSEDELRVNFRALLQEDNMGFLSPQALRAQGLTENEIERIGARLQNLETRFPDVYDEERALFFEPPDFEPPDIDFDSEVARFSSLPDTAPAVQYGEANPYDTTAPTTSPLAWADKGVASLYSRSARASQDLRQPAYGDINQLRKELEARGAPPRELDLQMDYLQDLFAESPSGRVSAEDVQGLLGNAPGISVSRSDKFAEYGPAGGSNYTSTVYTHPSAQQGPKQSRLHFGTGGGYGSLDPEGLPPLFHTRAAQYEITTPDGNEANAHHVLEIQSDWAQYRQTLPSSNEPTEEVMREARNLMRAGRVEEAEALVNRTSRAEFDETYPAPLLKNENDWVDAGVRQNLLDAVNSGSDWITFGNGRQAAQHVGMPLHAAERFYDKQVPKSVERVLRKLSREAGIEMPELQSVPFVDGDDVRGLQITPQLREALLEIGLPSFRQGGLVTAGEALMSAKQY